MQVFRFILSIVSGEQCGGSIEYGIARIHSGCMFIDKGKADISWGCGDAGILMHNINHQTSIFNIQVYPTLDVLIGARIGIKVRLSISRHRQLG
ncbi:MAG: hypothetical protein ACKJRN_10315, partial [Porticoccaceae bacterium]